MVQSVSRSGPISAHTSWVTVGSPWMTPSLGLIFFIRKEVSDLDLAVENRDVPHTLGRDSTGAMVINQTVRHHRLQRARDAGFSPLSLFSPLTSPSLSSSIHLFLSVLSSVIKSMDAHLDVVFYPEKENLKNESRKLKCRTSVKEGFPPPSPTGVFPEDAGSRTQKKGGQASGSRGWVLLFSVVHLP